MNPDDRVQFQIQFKEKLNNFPSFEVICSVLYVEMFLSVNEFIYSENIYCFYLFTKSFWNDIFVLKRVLESPGI